MELKPMNCPNCGGTVDRARMICEYCGTRFKQDETSPTLRLETYSCPIRPFIVQTMIPSEYLQSDNTDYIAEYAMRDITSRLADSLKEMLELRREHDFMHNQEIITARIRVVDPNYRF